MVFFGVDSISEQKRNKQENKKYCRPKRRQNASFGPLAWRWEVGATSLVVVFGGGGS